MKLAGKRRSRKCQIPLWANCLVLRKAGALAEKAQIAAENSAVIVFARSSVARVGRTSFSLDKDLSWMAGDSKWMSGSAKGRSPRREGTDRG